MNFITLCDGYKLDHRRQFPKNTTRIYCNFTPRTSRVDGQDKVVFFGLQYFLQRYLTEVAHDTFFDVPRSKILSTYDRFTKSYLGPNHIGTDHIAQLHDYGRIPLVFYAHPEGRHVPLRMPMFTYENTEPEFFWVPNWIETLMSSVLWLPCTSATTAFRYRKFLDEAARLSGGSADFVQWQGHDFSFRGMGCPEAAALSGAGHLLSFTGTDTIPAIELLERYYAGSGLIGGSVAATEHSVMCAGGKESELDTFNRLLDLYPSGIVSVVSDTWDLWKVIQETLPQLKDRVMHRDGKLVVRPDSGDPVHILTGDPDLNPESPEGRGVVELLWNLFGGTVNAAGYKELDSHIGAIYGDSITEKRAGEICSRLLRKGFASTNVVLGIGSYTYQYVTRDTYGFAVKATWAEVDGKERFLAKDPITDSGIKKSASGRISTVRNKQGKTITSDNLDLAHWQAMIGSDELRRIWQNGEFIGPENTLESMRQRVGEG